MALWGRRRLTRMAKDDNNTPIDDPEQDFARSIDRALADCRARIGSLPREHGRDLHGFVGVRIYFKGGRATGHDIEVKETHK